MAAKKDGYIYNNLFITIEALDISRGQRCRQLSKHAPESCDNTSELVRNYSPDSFPCRRSLRRYPFNIAYDQFKR